MSQQRGSRHFAPILTVTAANGVTFNVTFGCRLAKHYDRPVVSFYDARHGVPELGQFVSDYYPETILERDARFGLDLMGGIDDWTVDAATMATVTEWVERQVRERSQLPERYVVLQGTKGLYLDDGSNFVEWVDGMSDAEVRDLAWRHVDQYREWTREYIEARARGMRENPEGWRHADCDHHDGICMAGGGGQS